MSNEFIGVTFPWQKVAPSDDGLIHAATLRDGVAKGCDLAYAGATLTMGAGFLMICGRLIRHPSAQSWSVADASAGFARLVITVDTTKTSTKEIFDQVSASIEYAATEDGFAGLIQEDINDAGTRYQVSACVMELSAAGISRIIWQMSPVALRNDVANGTYAGDLNSLDIPLNSIAWVAAGTCTNCPTTSSAYLETWGSQQDIRFQRITTEGGSRVQRRYYNNAWTEWEWENPPLITGKEYRTTERWNGHVVYVRGVSCGTLTAGRKVVEVPDLAKCIPISTIGYVNQGSNNYTMVPSIYYSTDEDSTIVVLVNTTGVTGNIQLFVGAGYAGKTATVQVKYFKV